MPFTTAHPALVLPLKMGAPRYFSLTGLLLGSMAPDVEYFLFLQPISPWGGHSFWGTLYLGFPLSIGLALLFHGWMRAPLQELLPCRLQRRLHGVEAFDLRSTRGFLLFATSYLLGAWSHLFWDHWTHGTGLFVTYFPALQGQALASLPWYKLLQYGSFFAGTAVEALLLLLWYRRAEVSTQPTSKRPHRNMYPLGIAMIGVLGAFGNVWMRKGAAIFDGAALKSVVGLFLCGGMAFGFLGMLGVSTWLCIIDGKQKP